MKLRRRERLFWREHDPKPAPADAEAHERLRRSHPNSAKNLGAPTYDRGTRSAFGNFAGIPMREGGRRTSVVLPGVCERLHVSRVTLWRMVKRGKFPRPDAADGRRRALWHPQTIDAWCKANAAHFEKVLNRIPAALARLR